MYKIILTGIILTSSYFIYKYKNIFDDLDDILFEDLDDTSWDEFE